MLTQYDKQRMGTVQITVVGKITLGNLHTLMYWIISDDNDEVIYIKSHLLFNFNML